MTFWERAMYDTFSHDYDHFVNWKNRLNSEIPFLIEKITSTIRKPTSDIRILDAATGTGMHAIALAQQGFITAGVDISAGMIETARKNARQNNVDINFTTAGFGEIHQKLFQNSMNKSLSQEESGTPFFDVILCLGNSLPHVENRTELKAALKDFAACLTDGGLLILQNRNFDAVLDTKDRWMEPQSYGNGEDESIFLRFYDFLPDELIQFNIVTLQRKNQGEWKQSILETKLFPIKHELLSEVLAETGFHLTTEFGTLSDVPFNKSTSGNLVITARKNKTYKKRRIFPWILEELIGCTGGSLSDHVSLRISQLLLRNSHHDSF